MRKDFEKLFSRLKSPEPPANLFDKIILEIKRERELRHTKRLAFGFLTLSIISFIAVPFSWTILANQVESSGILYFLSIIASDTGVALSLWQDAGLAILESLPIMGISMFTINMILILFTIRLFLHRKRLLFGYLIHGTRFS